MGFTPGMQGLFNIEKLINVIHHINRMKEKNYMIFTINAENIWQNSTLPWWKLKILGIEGTYSNKSSSIVYINNKICAREIKKSIPFTIESGTVKY